LSFFFVLAHVLVLGRRLGGLGGLGGLCALCGFCGFRGRAGPFLANTSFAVDDLEGQLEGKDVVVPITVAAPGVRIAYFLMDGALIEYMEVKA
jgi:hypothetical protein